MTYDVTILFRPMQQTKYKNKSYNRNRRLEQKLHYGFETLHDTFKVGTIQINN